MVDLIAGSIIDKKLDKLKRSMRDYQKRKMPLNQIWNIGGVEIDPESLWTGKTQEEEQMEELGILMPLQGTERDMNIKKFLTAHRWVTDWQKGMSAGLVQEGVSLSQKLTGLDIRLDKKLLLKGFHAICPRVYVTPPLLAKSAEIKNPFLGVSSILETQ